MQLPIKPCNDNFQLPVYSSLGAGAFDLFSPTGTTILKGESLLVKLGFQAKIPDGYVALLFTRSGLGCKMGIGLRNHVGVIDSDYRGEWMVKLAMDNFTDVDKPDPEGLQINIGDRIVQCLVVPVPRCTFKIVDALDETNRSDGGFGSTGV